MSHPLRGNKRMDGPEWKAQRSAYLADHPECVLCGRPSDTVDHRRAHGGDEMLFWDRANWQALCTPCHNRKTMVVDVKGRSTKTDNSYLRTKLELRRHFLRRYPGELRVLDCCQGSGQVWGRLRREFRLATYWGVDKKKQRGRLQMDSVRILAQPGWRENVIDVDTFGSPWEHWAMICRNLCHPATVFLTDGFVPVNGVGLLSQAAQEALGVASLNTPIGLKGRLHALSVDYCLAQARPRLKIVEAAEGKPHGRNARYLGVRLEPA